MVLVTDLDRVDFSGLGARRLTLFVTQNQRRGDITRNRSPAGLNKTIGASYSSKGILKEIQVTLVALRALVNNLTKHQ